MKKHQRSSILFFGIVLMLMFSASSAAGWDHEGPTLGPADAPVKIAFYYDFQCGHCKKTAPVMLSLVDDYKNLVQLTAVNFPSPGHSYAEPSAELALTAADHGKFREAFILLFEKQSELSPDNLIKYGKALGLDEKTVRANLENHAHRKIIKRDFYKALEIGLTATPTIFVNETKLMGYHDADYFKWHINQELKKKGIKSPVGEVPKPVKKKDPYAKSVPSDMIFVSKPMPPNNSKLLVEVGQKAPEFGLETIDGKEISLSDYLGKANVVISFVPAAWTPVCSAQWPEYNENKDVFDKNETKLIGISVDNRPSLFAWCGTMGDLWFPVVSDFYPHGATAKEYGVLREEGVAERALFLIDKKGIIRYIDVHDINSKPNFEILKSQMEKLNQ